MKIFGGKTCFQRINSHKLFCVGGIFYPIIKNGFTFFHEINKTAVCIRKKDFWPKLLLTGSHRFFSQKCFESTNLKVLSSRSRSVEGNQSTEVKIWSECIQSRTNEYHILISRNFYMHLFSANIFAK